MSRFRRVPYFTTVALALTRVAIAVSMPLVLRRLINLIGEGNRLSLAFAFLMAVLFVCEAICTVSQTFINNRYAYANR